MTMSRQLFTFNGGVHPDGHKAESNATPIRAMPLLPRYVVPLRQHIGAPARPLVQAGDTVLRGQMIGAPEGYVSTAVHAPTSGRVVAVEPHAVPHPSGLFDLCVVIEADGEDRSIDFQPLDWRKLDPSALRNRIREMGLAGLGGAVFPSYIKLNPSGQTIHTLILNGAECEPWITCDDRLMRERAAEIVQGIEIMAHTLGVKTILIGIEDNKPEALAAMGAAAPAGMEVVAVPTGYPGGGGKQLTYTLTGVETPTGGRSTDAGIQVFNVGTAYSLYRAVTWASPSSVAGGDGDRPRGESGQLRGPHRYPHDRSAGGGGRRPAGADGEIVGGPMMGFDLMDRAAPVTKSVNCLIVKNPVLFPPKPTDPALHPLRRLRPRLPG
jgi:electron transport complex protein RnfC